MNPKNFPDSLTTGTSDLINSLRQKNPRIAVIIPCFRVKAQILSVIESIPLFIESIYLIDDRCPEETGHFVRQSANEPRLQIIFNEKNLGVGGAVMEGYKKALEDGIDIMVKIDGDGQMNPALIRRFIAPLIRGEADYTKGNRFFDLESLASMPPLRLFGNAALSFINKAVSGYWNVMDPTNGFTAISRYCLSRLPLQKIEKRYFFESDILFRLGTLRAVVKDIPMDAIYESEKSNLRIKRIIFEFPPKYISRIFKRIFYNYFLRDFSVVSVCLIIGFLLVSIGALIGIGSWINNASVGIFTSTGTVMLAVLPILIGVQLLLIALVLDVLSVPKEAFSRNPMLDKDPNYNNRASQIQT